MTIGVFTGSFDPVHKGHIGIITYLLEEEIIDKAIVIATGNYWHKQNITQLNKRLDMLEFIKNEKIIIDRKYNDYACTYQILEEIEAEYPNDDICYILGADNANTLYLWDNYEEIIKRKIIVINRNDIKINLNTQNQLTIQENFGNISSTKIRNNPEEYKDFLEEGVYEYIKENNLYKKRVRTKKENSII